MDAILQARFQRVETAFSALLDSITSYNPSPQAAVDLVAADDDLSKGLDQLAEHQANYARILSLRQTAEALESQVRSHVTTLADLRKQLLATPATTFPQSSRNVPFTELLTYARQISEFSVPPTYRPPSTLEHPSAEQGEFRDEKVSDGVQTPLDGQETPHQPPEENKGKGWSKLTEDQKEFLENRSRLPFVPWPTDDRIRGGALGVVQRMLQRGEDPSQVLGPAQQEAEDKRRAAEEEKEKQERDELEAEERRRRESMYASGPRQQQQQPAQFGGLDMYEVDDDD